MTDPVLWLRSLFFNVGWYAGSAVIAILGAPILLLPRRAVVAWSRFWIRFVLWWLRLTVGLTHRVSGRENLPPGPCIIASKHQSSWETMAYTVLFDDAAIVLKRELVFIPVVGWAMARAGNITVARGDGDVALRKLQEHSRLFPRGALEEAGRGGPRLDPLAVDLVRDAEEELVDPREDVELVQHDRGDRVHRDRVAERDRVEPADAPRAPGDGPELVAALRKERADYAGFIRRNAIVATD